MDKWSNLEIKTKIAYITAIVAFGIGWALTIAGFIVEPVGQIEESVLWVLGQSLVYSASVFGVAIYVTNSVREMKKNVSRYLRNNKIEIDEDEE